MPRGRSKSRTPKKDKEGEKGEVPTSPKRQRTTSLSGENVETSIPTRTSPRRRRASSTSAEVTPSAVGDSSAREKTSESKTLTTANVTQHSPSAILVSSSKKVKQQPRNNENSSIGIDQPAATKTPKKKVQAENSKDTGKASSSKKSKHSPKAQQKTPNDKSSDSNDSMDIDMPVSNKSSQKTKTPSTHNAVDKDIAKGTVANDADNLIQSKLVKKQHPATMNVKVHRVRHLDYIPSPVLAMASTGSYFAISRQNGHIELYDTTSIAEHSQTKKLTPHLFPLATMAGSKRAVAHSLAWVNDLLVAASPDGTLWTVPFAGRTRQLESRIASGGGGVFDLATCLSLPLVAGACQDGSVRIWQISDGKLQEPPIATLSTTGAPLLSLTWRCSQQLGDHTFKTQVYVSVSDATIRKYYLDIKLDDSGIQVLKNSADLRMTVESRGRRTPTKVWTMKALDDGSLATGNSLGQIQIWDTVTGTLMHSFYQSELGADVLKLAVNNSQTKLFASGVDSRVVCLERTTSTDTMWKFTTAQRPHTHDVKCMAVVCGNSGTNAESLETLVTAGVDTKICSYVVSDFTKRRPQVNYPWPSQSPVSSTTQGDSRRVLSIHRDDQIELYRLDDNPQKHGYTSTTELMGEIALDTQTNLSISLISPNGHWLAAANATQLFLFGLQEAAKNDESELDLEPKKLSLPKPLDRTTVVALHFCNNTLFVADSTHRVHVVEVSENVSIVSTFTLPKTTDLPICSIRTSPDGVFVVTMTKSSQDGVHVFRRSDDGTYSTYWTIPGLGGSRPAAITLLGSTQVAIATVLFQVYVFDLAGRKLSPWSQANKFPIEKWPAEISNRKDFPVRLFANPNNESQLIMASFGAFIVLNLDGQLPNHCRVIPEMHVRSRRKRQRDDDTLIGSTNKSNPVIFVPPHQRNQGRNNFHHDPNARNCTVCLNYNSMLHMDFLGSDNEMVVVEQPWLRVISTFPEALQRRVYGCN